MQFAILSALFLALNGAMAASIGNDQVLAADGTGISCHSNHGALGSDCEQLFNQFGSDGTVQSPDSHGRASIVFGSCAVVVHYSGQSQVSNEDLVQWGSSAYASCFSDSQQFESAVQQKNAAEPKFCLCNNNSQGSC